MEEFEEEVKVLDGELLKALRELPDKKEMDTLLARMLSIELDTAGTYASNINVVDILDDNDGASNTDITAGAINGCAEYDHGNATLRGLAIDNDGATSHFIAIC